MYGAHISGGAQSIVLPVAILLLTVCLLPATIQAQEQKNAEVAVDAFDWQYLYALTYRQHDKPARADDTLRAYEQPNGTKLLARLRGVESYHWYETEDGRVIWQNEKSRYFEYLVLDGQGRYTFSGVLVGIDDPGAHGIPPYIRESKEIIRQKVGWYLGPVRPAGAFPAVKTQARGVVKQLVILVRYAYTDPEDPYTTPVFTQDTFDRYFNEEGFDFDGAHGSFRDYYLEVSYGNLDVQSTVTDWVTLPHDLLYYGGKISAFENGPPRYNELVQDSIDTLDASGFDFSDFDENGDGIVDSLCILHQREGGENSGGLQIWSKKNTLDVPIEVDGVSIVNWYTVPEQRSYEEISHIGVPVHEFGHMLGLDDLYDPVNKPDAVGVGEWCLMSNGNFLDAKRRPAHPLAFNKIKLNWISPTVIRSTSSRLKLRDFSRYGEAIKISRRMGSQEYFLLENRQQRRFDSALPGQGLIITHVDDNVVQNVDPTHYRVAVVQADGKQQLEGLGGFGSNKGDAGDPFPGSGNVRNLGPSTDPSTDNCAGGNTGIYISNIVEDLRTVVFDVGLGSEPEYPFWPGPDDFGYSGFLISGGFEDISADGTSISFDDKEDGVEMVTLPSDFKFYFYTNRKVPSRHFHLRTLRVSTNGWFSMGAGSTDSMPRNKRLPDSEAHNYLIAPFWKDMRVDEPGLYVKYKLVGSKPNRTFIVQWRAKRQRAGILNRKVKFQVKLHEEGHMEFCYDTVGSFGALSATVGIQKNGLTGLCYSFLGERPLNNGDRIVISRNSPPFGMLVTPERGSGFGATFSARYVDPDGVDDLSECHFLLNTSDSTVGGVYVMYNNDTGQIGLRNGGDTDWILGTPGDAGTLSNSRVDLELAGVTVGGTGNILTLGIPLEFKSTFTGSKNIYLKAADSVDHESDWVSAWTYSISIHHAPELLGITPSGGTGKSVTFRPLYRDLNGPTDLRYVSLIVSESLSTVESVYIRYDVAAGEIWLRNDADTGWIKAPLGAAGTIFNGNVEIDLSGTGVAYGPITLELTLPLRFKKGYLGSKIIYMRAEDHFGLVADWEVRGSWVVN